MRFKKYIFITLISLFFNLLSFAQSPGYLSQTNTTGTPDYGSFISSNIDQVNLANGGLTINIPLISRHYRGFDLKMGYRYDSKYWVADPTVVTLFQNAGGTTSGKTYAWRIDAVDAGWNISANYGGNMEYVKTVYQCATTMTGNVPNPPVFKVFISNFIYTAGDGTKYQFPVRRQFDINNGSCNEFPPGLLELPVGPSNQGNMQLDISASQYNQATSQVDFAYTLTHKDGTVEKYSLPSTANSLPTGSITDRNGNILGPDAPFTVAYPNSQNPSVYQWQYTDSNGTQRNITFTNTGLSNLSSNFPSTPAYDSSSGPVPAVTNGIGGSLSVLQSIQLPNNLSYSFSYIDPTTGSVNTSGEIMQVNLPTGGYIKYKWGYVAQRDLFNPIYINYNNTSLEDQTALDSRVLIERRVSADGGQTEQVWSYSYGTSGNSVTTTVIDPMNYMQVHYFDPLLDMKEVKTLFYDTDHVTVKKEIDYDWDLQYNSPVLLSVNAPSIKDQQTQNNNNPNLNPTCGYFEVDSGPICGPGTTGSNPPPYSPGGIGSIVTGGNRDYAPSGTTTITYDNGITESSIIQKHLGDCWQFTNDNIQIPGGTPVQYQSCTDNPTEIDEFGYNSSTPIRITDFNYYHQTNSNISNFPILDLVTEKKIYDETTSPATLASDTLYKYDTYGANSYVSLTATTASNAQSHDVTFGTSMTTRGNLTETDGMVSANSYIASYNSYDILGNVVSTTDPMLNTTNFSYTDNFTDGTNHNSYRFVTAVTAPSTNGTAHVTQKQYDWNTGLVMATCGENFTGSNCSVGLSGFSDYVTHVYDYLNRPKDVYDSGGGHSHIDYNESSSSINMTLTTTHVSGISVVSEAVLDGLGRTKQKQLVSDPQGIDYTDTTYDALGRVSSVSNPYRSTSDSTYGITVTEYDALSRVVDVIPPDGNAFWNNVSTTYSGNCATVTDQAGHARTSCSDALGRLTQVTEDPSGLAFVTNYTYDMLGNLLCVEQHGNASGTGCSSSPSNDSSSPWRVRRFTYDSLSRLLTSHNPETGTITYAYDANGNVISKTSPAQNTAQNSTSTVTVTYSYDALNRQTLTYINDGISPWMHFNYDETAPFGVTMHNYIGRLTSSATNYAGALNYNVMIFDHDVMGRATNIWDCRAGMNTCPIFEYTYNPDGTTASLQYPSGTKLYDTYDTAGRQTCVSTAANCGGTIYKQAVSFFPNGAMQTGALGVVSGTATVNLTDWLNKRLQRTDILAQHGSTTLQDLDYNFYDVNGKNNGNVYTVNNWKNTARSQSYSYDSLNRLTSAWSTTQSGSSGWGISYALDPWGNMTQKNLLSGYAANPDNMSNSVNLVNQLTSQVGYDAAGNMTSFYNGVSSLAPVFDAYNHIKFVASIGYEYDTDDRRIRKFIPNTADFTKDYWYGLNPAPLTETDGNQNITTEYYFFGGQRIAQNEFTYSSNPTSTLRYYLGDNIGSTSLLINSDGSICSESDYYPYGKESVVQAPCTSTEEFKYTGKERDSESGLDYFGARYFASSMGRWMSPDWSEKPMAVPYSQYDDPQSLNLYGYVRNNPITGIDADGHCGGGDTPNCQKLPNNPANVPAPVKQAINDSVKASNSPTADDKKGGSHEEGGVAYTKDGKQVIAPAEPGKFKDVTQPGAAQVDPYKAADPAKQKPGDVQADVAWHVHPSATSETTTTNANGQTVVTTSSFNQPPSSNQTGGGDIQNAAPAPTVNIVVGAGDKTVYVYDSKGCTCKESLKDFNKPPKQP